MISSGLIDHKKTRRGNRFGDVHPFGQTTMRRELDNVPAWARHPFQDDGVHVNPLDYMGLQHAALKAVDRKVDRLKLALQEIAKPNRGRKLALV